MQRFLALTASAALVFALSACGSDGGGSESATSDANGTVVVSAAASLQTAFDAYGRSFDGTVRFSFAGSDELAAQIRQGVKPDVFAAANTALPDELYAAGLVEKPTAFAGNRLVLAVPADSRVTALGDVRQPGVTLALGSPSVPVGAYTRTVLERLPAAQRDAVLANVRSQEPDVKGIVGKLTQGAVDAGFVYATDVTATKGALRAIELPAALQPRVAYGAAVVKGAKNPAGARAFIAGLRHGAGQEALRQAGFDPPPS